jgi:GNAT superfamily N-acetyltransferase
MFADLDLAARIENAEASLTREAARAFGCSNFNSTAFAIDIGAGVASFLRPGSPMNKVIGIFGGLPPEAQVVQLEHRYRERAEAVRVELSTLAEPDIGRRLTERGYRLLGFENVLGRSLTVDEPSASGEIDIEPVADDQREGWKRIVVDGFAQPDETGVVVDSFTREIIEQAMSDFLGVEGFNRYIARCNGVEAGGASMRISGDIALLTGAATLKEHRRRGVQSALLERRIRDAAVLGAQIAVITTAGGTRSQANAMSHGFSLLYSRAILVLEA